MPFAFERGLHLTPTVVGIAVVRLRMGRHARASARRRGQQQGAQHDQQHGGGGHHATAAASSAGAGQHCLCVCVGVIRIFADVFDAMRHPAASGQLVWCVEY